MKYKGKEITRQTLNSQDVRAYLSYLALRHRVSSSTQNQAFNALLFLFNEVLHIELSNLGKTVRAKRGPKLPVVLTPEELQKLFKQVESKNLLILQLLYGSGIRLMELARLRVKDIDFASNLIFVRSSKGDKDRSTILPELIKPHLQTHLLMNGVNIREVQELLGHKNVETTMVYTHVMRDMSNIPKSPLDNLYVNSHLDKNLSKHS